MKLRNVHILVAALAAGALGVLASLWFGGSPLLRHRVELGRGSVADDVLGTPKACVSELRYPATGFDSAGTVLELAGGGSLSTWQGQRLGG